MGAGQRQLKVVLDTNTVVSALVFSSGHLAWLRKAWQQGRLRPLVHRETVEELIRVLAYPKFKLTPSEIEDLLSAYLPYTEVVSEWLRRPELPECRDTDDQVFLGLAATGGAEALITGDQDLLELATPRLSFEILTPRDLRERLEE